MTTEIKKLEEDDINNRSGLEDNNISTRNRTGSFSRKREVSSVRKTKIRVVERIVQQQQIEENKNNIEELDDAALNDRLEGISQYAELIFSSNVRVGIPKKEIISESNIQNPSYADVLGCALYDYNDFSDNIIEKQGKKQKKQGYKGFFSWLDQYI